MPALKTARLPTSLRRSALPASESRNFLQIYQLTNERKRLEKSLLEWKMRVAEAEMQLGKINERIEELHGKSQFLRPSTKPRKPLHEGSNVILEY
jgi:hypothetical protein